VGPTLKQVFGQTVANSDEVVRYFMKLLLMIQRLTDAKIEWHKDFHSSNVCYDTQSGVWKMIDLEKIETATTLPSSAINTGVRKLMKHLDGHEPFKNLLKRYCTQEFARDLLYNGTWEMLEMIGRSVGVDVTTLEARTVVDHDYECRLKALRRLDLEMGLNR